MNGARPSCINSNGEANSSRGVTTCAVGRHASGEHVFIVLLNYLLITACESER